MVARDTSHDCHVYGDHPSRIFRVEIAETKTVGDLKNAIKEEKKSGFDHFQADKLVLRKVSMPVDDSIDQKLKNVAQQKLLSRSTLKLSKLFTDVSDEDLHVVVECPQAVVSPTILELNCWVLGDDTSLIFPVEIAKTQTVGALRAAIKKKMKPNFDHLPADMLVLRKVSIPVDDSIDQKLKNVAQQKPLFPMLELSQLFPDVSDEDLHVVVECPRDVVSSSSTIFELNCWVLGDNLSQISTVRIGKNRTVAVLKDAIKEEKKPDFDYFPADELVLWMVNGDSVPCGTDGGKLEAVTHEAPLLPLQELLQVFPVGVKKGHVHIVIKKPPISEAHDENNDRVRGLPEITRYNDMIKTPGKSPSLGAKSMEYSRIQSEPKEAIYDGRLGNNGLSTVAPPIQIFHPIFEEFMRRAHDMPRKVTAEEGRVTLELMKLLAVIGRNEPERNEKICERLRKVLRLDVVEETNEDSTTPDGSIVFTLDGICAPMLIVELKREIGDGGSDPSTQAGLAMRRSWIQENRQDVRNQCCCPTLMLASAGAWVTILGGVMTDKVIVQRLTDFMWVAQSSTSDEGRIMRFAHVLNALRECVLKIKEYYISLDGSKKVIPYSPSRPTAHPRFYPYPTSYIDDNNCVVRFEYVRMLEDDAACVTFLAEMIADRNNAGEMDTIVVKFVSRYGKEVHKFLADSGDAPRLRYHGSLDSFEGEKAGQFLMSPNMRMVVMDYVSTSESIPRNAREQITAVVKKLHQQGYVFGDLRRPNVLFNTDGKLQLIDFDWAGRYKQSEDDKNGDDNYARYPYNLSRNIEWADGVKDGEEILPGHELEMLEKLGF